MGDGDLVKLSQPFCGRDVLADEDSVDAFEVGEDDELLHGGVISDVARGLGV